MMMSAVVDRMVSVPMMDTKAAIVVCIEGVDSDWV